MVPRPQQQHQSSEFSEGMSSLDDPLYEGGSEESDMEIGATIDPQDAAARSSKRSRAAAAKAATAWANEQSDDMFSSNDLMDTGMTDALPDSDPHNATSDLLLGERKQ